MQQGFTLLEPFLKITRDDYGAEAADADFAHQPDAARATINTWVAKQTNDRIKDLFPAGTLDPTTKLVLANAIYFKGDWQVPFKKEGTHKAPFHLTAAKTTDVDTMHQTRHFRYFKSDDLQILEMPYKSGDVAMVVLLPTKIDGLTALEKSLAGDQFDKWISRAARQPGDRLVSKIQVDRPDRSQFVPARDGNAAGVFIAGGRFLRDERQDGFVHIQGDPQSVRRGR